ncbi:MAG: amidohydrolase family protein [Bacteroidetes bacterium]|nr:MAG: amidohydrolase family protein [Bacteroidota bacterium]
MKKIILLLLAAFIGQYSYAQDVDSYLLRPDKVFDGTEMHSNWIVITQGEKILYAGTEKGAPKATSELKQIDMPGTTLLPGLIEGHGHLLLHPYSETPWNDQILKEPESYRVARATVHARQTLEAGFTTFRDLGTEGAGYADYGIKKAIEEGIIPGPRLLISSKAIVATGSYGPKGFSPDFDLPLLGAEPADGDNLVTVVRTQIAKGADFIKVYADYRWGPNGEAMPTFSEAEIRLMVETARSSGRDVVAHAATEEGMRRAINAGVVMIEHGDGGTDEIFKLMKERGVALCPTLAAGYAITEYGGWNPKTDPEPERISNKRASFKRALASGVVISAGGDVGVFSHGYNVVELEMMEKYGMKPIDILKSVTSVNAELFHLEGKVGTVKQGMLADILVVRGDPGKTVSDLWNVELVMQGGEIVVEK